MLSRDDTSCATKTSVSVCASSAAVAANFAAIGLLPPAPWDTDLVPIYGRALNAVQAEVRFGDVIDIAVVRRLAAHLDPRNNNQRQR